MSRADLPGGIRVEVIDLELTGPRVWRGQRTVPPPAGRQYVVTLHGFVQGHYTEAELAAALPPALMAHLKELTERN